MSRSSSQEKLHSLPEAPYERTKYTNGGLKLSSMEPLLTSTLPRTNHRPEHLPLARCDSNSTLDESGISSKGSSMFDDPNSPFSWSTSAPSTPTLLTRRKPPPKPPRIKSYIENNDQSLSPTQSVRSSLEPSKASLADVTFTLDASVAKGSPDGSLVMKPNPLLMKDKVFQVLIQTREFLFYEINPENILGYLTHRGVINVQTEQELRQCQSRQAMCEMLLDTITSKGNREFVIFCESLRKVEKQEYLADLLLVIDRLIETVKLTSRRSLNRSLSCESTTSYNSQPLDGSDLCDTCKWDNNNESEEVLNDCSAFDIEISYYDKETGHIKSIKDVATIKKKGKQISLEKDTSFLGKMGRENADRYVPVISLSLYNQCLYHNGIDTLAKILEEQVCIRELSLAKNHLEGRAMHRLGKALQSNRGLVKLDIRLNTIGDNEAKYLANGLKTNASLRTLNVTGTELSGSGCNTLLAGLIRSHSLTDLDLGFNDLNDEGCKGLADFIGNNPSLKKLRMRDNNVTDKGATVLFRALKKNSRLSILDLSSNCLGNESIASLSEILLHNRSLRELNLEKCYISKLGCMAFARALKTNRTLRFIDLSMNPISDEGVEALSDGLKYNQILDVLCLNMCRIGNKGFSKLLEALRYNTTMTSLKLCYNLIGSEQSHVKQDARFASNLIGSERSHVKQDARFSPNLIGSDQPHNCDDVINTTQDSALPDLDISQDGSPTTDELYETLCQILQFNKSLKVLLWGNKFKEAFNSSQSMSSCNNLVPETW